MKMDNSIKISKRRLTKVCKTCATGSCCKDGVDVDLEEAKKISQLDINLEKPWFDKPFEDSDMPSGWAVSTVTRDGRCVFQASDYRCRIYEHRPVFCRDFPLEMGQIAEHYDYLCEKPHHFRRKTKKDL